MTKGRLRGKKLLELLLRNPSQNVLQIKYVLTEILIVIAQLDAKEQADNPDSSIGAS